MGLGFYDHGTLFEDQCLLGRDRIHSSGEKTFLLVGWLALLGRLLS